MVLVEREDELLPVERVVLDVERLELLPVERVVLDVERLELLPVERVVLVEVVLPLRTVV